MTNRSDRNWYYVDVHVHLTHDRFSADLESVVARASQAGCGALVVNGLEPSSNRKILEMARTWPDLVKPALGIYPTDAVNSLLPDDFPHRVGRFDVEAEIAFIASQAAAGNLVAVGECGLDGYWLKDDTYAAQEKVLLALAEVAMTHDLPLIVHTRKLEARAIEILAAHGVEKINFHCFGGRVKWAIKVSEEHGWYFSIPANASRSESFRKMLSAIPVERLLTETDAPYLAPRPGERSEPQDVVGTVALLAELRGWTVDQAGERIWRNYQTLFEKGKPT